MIIVIIIIIIISLNIVDIMNITMIRTCICIYIYIYMYACMFVCMYVYVCMYIYIYIHMRIGRADPRMVLSFAVLLEMIGQFYGTYFAVFLEMIGKCYDREMTGKYFAVIFPRCWKWSEKSAWKSKRMLEIRGKSRSINSIEKNSPAKNKTMPETTAGVNTTTLWNKYLDSAARQETKCHLKHTTQHQVLFLQSIARSPTMRHTGPPKSSKFLTFPKQGIVAKSTPGLR